MIEEKRTDYPKDADTLVKLYEDEAIRCCINSWNHLCPDYPLTNLTEMIHRKRWRIFGHDIALLKESGTCGEISKIALEANKHLTAKALHKHPDSPTIVLNCWVWWNCETGVVRGWSNYIEVDVAKCCVAQFPEVYPAAPHIDL